MTSSVDEEYAAPPVVQTERSSRGCLYGCLFVFVGGLALMVCAGVATYWWLGNQVERFTSATPVELPTVEFEPERLAELEARVDAFSEGIEGEQAPTEDLILTAEEINALIAKEEKARGRVYVTIEDGEVSADVSVPVPPQIPGGRGRYFNGSAGFNVSMEDGVLIVTCVEAEVNGEQLPDQLIEGLAKENLAKEVYKDPESAKLLRKIESVSVEGDKIILRVKKDAESTEAGTATSGGENDGADANTGTAENTAAGDIADAAGADTSGTENSATENSDTEDSDASATDSQKSATAVDDGGQPDADDPTGETD